MQSVDFCSTGKNNENQLFQVPSITQSEMYECVERNDMSHAVLYNYLKQISIQEDQLWILLFEWFTILIWK